MTRPLGTIRCYDDISTGSTQFDQGTERAGATSGARPTNRLVAESRNDPRNDFSIAMLADQDMSARSPIPYRNHQLLSMPKCQDNGAPFSIQRINLVVAPSLTPHRTCNATNERRSDRRQGGQLQPFDERLGHDINAPTLQIETAARANGDSFLPAGAAPHANLSRRSFRALTPRCDPHFESWRADGRSPTSFDSS